MRLRALPSAPSARHPLTRLKLGDFQASLSGEFSVDDDKRRLSGLDRSKGDATASPFHLLVEAPIGRGTKALNPGGAGAKPRPPSAPHAGRPLIMRDSAC